VQDKMSGIGSTATQYSASDIQGSPQPGPSVCDKLQDFHSDWSDGLGKIETQISDLTARLKGASKTYGDTESALQKAATPSGGSSSGSPGGGAG